MKKQLIFLFTAGVLLLSSCLKDDSTTNPPFASVSLSNYLTTENSIFYQVDNKNVTNSNGNYEGITGFYAIPGNKNIKAFEIGSTTKLIDTNLTFVDSSAYSCYIFGLRERPEFIRTNDNAISNLGNKSGIRFIHLANGIGKVNITIGTQDIKEFLNRDKETKNSVVETQKFRSATGGTFTITAKDSEGNIITTLNNITLREGGYQNLILIGTKGNTKFPLKLVYNTYY